MLLLKVHILWLGAPLFGGRLVQPPQYGNFSALPQLSGGLGPLWSLCCISELLLMSCCCPDASWLSFVC